MKIQQTTSWDSVGQWYSSIVGQKGHYYHRQVIIPKLFRMLNLSDNSSILDLACGSGILAYYIPKTTYYQGVDIAESLIKIATNLDKNRNHHYQVADITKPLKLSKNNFTHTVIILALQNIENVKMVIKNAYNHLENNGKLAIVINHPYFRIPKITSWEIDLENKIQYRRVNRYLTSIKIPITTHPGKGKKSEITWSFHYSLSSLSSILNQEDFVIEKIEEWVSDKVSKGPAAKMENLARSEFPLFMTILCSKRSLS